MGSTDWDPEQYRRFAAERSAPFWDLISLIEAHGIGRMVDLGCGDGELTAGVVDRLTPMVTIGLDSSAAMLEQAADVLRPGLRFEVGDLAEWTSDHDVDLVLANASLQWVPGHERVLRSWRDALAPGGQIAVQVPANGAHPSHVEAERVGQTEPYLSAMGGSAPSDPTRVNVLTPESYASILYDLGFVDQHVRLQVYPHVLESSGDVVEWVKGTNLTRFFKLLPIELHEPFVNSYRQSLLARIGDRKPYFYAFNRILMWGRLDV